MNLDIFGKLLAATRYFKSDKYKRTVAEAVASYDEGEMDNCQKLLEQLPTADQLLAQLVEKLKGKSVYKTLNKIREGQQIDSNIMLKGLSSLLTHTAIEIEHGNTEYLMLLPKIVEKISEFVV